MEYIKVNTDQLKKMIAIIKNGHSVNSLVPLTTMVEIKVEFGCISLGLSNLSSRIVTWDTVKTDQEMYGLVDFNKFYNLVLNTTTEQVKLKIDDDVLTFKGNGTNKFKLLTDYDGKIFRLDNINKDYDRKINLYVSKSKEINKIGNKFISDEPLYEAYNFYYISDTTIAGDGTKFIILKDSPIKASSPILFNKNVIGQLSTMEGNITCYINDAKDYYYICSDNTIISSNDLGNIGNYSEMMVNELLDEDYTKIAEIKSKEWDAMLKRINKFINPSYMSVILGIRDNKVYLTNSDETFIEIADLSADFDSNKWKDERIEINYSDLCIINSDSSEDSKVTIYYDGKICLKFDTNKAYYLIAKRK